MTTACSEQSGGFVVLLALCFVIYKVPLELPVPEPDCVDVTRGKYVDRNAEGIPVWDYFTVERCYE